MTDTIVVIVEQRDGMIAPVTFEALACAVELSRLNGYDITALTVGDDAPNLAEILARTSGQSCTSVKVSGLSSYNHEAYKSLLSSAIKSISAKWAVVPGTTQGLDFAPGLAIRLEASCLPNVIGVRQAETGLVWIRSMFNGKLAAEFSVDEPAVIITQPGSFVWKTDSSNAHPKIDYMELEYSSDRVRVINVLENEHSDAALQEASVIVSAGRGIRRRENLELVTSASRLFSRSSIAVSRPVCDDGWAPHRFQVGQTGATVSPDLYIACGISGAQQHLAGMRGSKFVVAINTDPTAPIFHEADIGIVEDVESFLREFLKASTNIDYDRDGLTNVPE